MKIEVKTQGTKEYYDEFLYIVSKYKLMLKNPRRKVFRLTKFLTVYSLVVFFCILFLILTYFQYKDILNVFLIGVMTLLLIYSLISLSRVKKQIKTFMNNKGARIIDMNENGVEYISEEKNLKVKWNDIASVVANKYSICFIPKQTTNIFMSISIDYKQEVIDGLRRYERGLLFIDNNS